MRTGLHVRTVQLGVNNLNYPGALPPRLLWARPFVMPSRSEGVFKVIQEAVTCGLGQVILGYYEGPSVVDGQNGFVVWSDEA